MCYSKYFNSNYIEFVDYGTRDKLICTSGEGLINKNTISKQGGPKININKTYNPSSLGFSCSSYKDTCDIFSENLVSRRLQENS